MSVIKVTMFSNGNVMAFKNGQQVGELQESFVVLYAKHCESQGVDPTTIDLELPSGRQAEIIKLEDGGYNWRIL